MRLRFSVLFVTFFTVFAATPLHSLPPIDQPPPLIRITGALLSTGEEAGSQYPTLDVKIADNSWTLRVREVESLTSADRGWPILRNLGAFLTLTGPPTLIDRLNSEESRGRPLLIEGRLYIGDRVLVLTAVESADLRFK